MAHLSQSDNLNKALGWNGSLWPSQLASPSMETPPYTCKLKGRRESHTQPLLPEFELLPHGFGGGGIGMKHAGGLPLPGRHCGAPPGAEGRGSPVSFAPHSQSGASHTQLGVERGSRCGSNATDSHSSYLNVLDFIIINKCFSICSMPLRKFPEIKKLKVIFTSYHSFTGERAYKAHSRSCILFLFLKYFHIILLIQNNGIIREHTVF